MTDTRLEFTVNIQGAQGQFTVLLTPEYALARYGLAAEAGVDPATATASRQHPDPSPLPLVIDGGTP